MQCIPQALPLADPHPSLRTKAEELAANVFEIPILQSLILSFADKPTLRTCSALSSTVHQEAIKHLYREVSETDLDHLGHCFCDLQRMGNYRRAVRSLRRRETISSLRSLSNGLFIRGLQTWYPALRHLEVNLADEAILRVSLQGTGEWIIHECRLSTMNSARLIQPEMSHPTIKWNCRTLTVGPSHFPGSTESRPEPTAQELMDFETLPLEHVRELRLSGFCLDGEDLLRLMTRMPHLQRLEFFGGSTELQEPVIQDTGFDYTNGLLAAKITKQCPGLKELTWHQCTEHRSDAFVLGCVQAGLGGLETMCVPWYDMLSSSGTAEGRRNSARWIHTFSTTGVPWQPAHANLKAVRLEMHPEDARLSNPFDLAVSLLLDFDMHAKIELGFRPSRHHVSLKPSSLLSTLEPRPLSNLEAHNMAILKSALEIRQILIASMPPRNVGYSLL